jgi:mono/diheme cytochrome c family protein
MIKERMCERLVVLAAVMMFVFAAGCAGGNPSPSPGGGQLAEGKALFTVHCAGCHTLADAGATGVVGPNLDQSKPPRTLVVERVMHGKGVMPPFTGLYSNGHFLTDDEVQAIADYVTSATAK